MASAQFSEPEIVRRLPVWSALSDVFLDTELDPHHYRHMADTIRAQEFTLAAAEAIFRFEVAPAFAANLWSVAGEWAGWSETTVLERVLTKMNSPFANLINRIALGKLLDEEWARIASLLDS